MRLTSAVDWHEFFESVSLVDEMLRDGSNFADMDFATRDQYRHAIEDLSRGTSRPEIEIAQRAVDRAKRSSAKLRSDNKQEEMRRGDPGYYLIAPGRLEFERELGYLVPLKRRLLLRLYVRAAVPGYLGTIFLLDGVHSGAPPAPCRGSWVLPTGA